MLAGTELNDDPLAPISTCGQRLRRRGRRRRAGRVADRRAALQREARDAGRLDRRPARRHRPDQGGDAQAHLRRPRGDPLRHRPAHQPRHLRHQRAARPGAAHPGGPAQHPRGARPADPRLPGAHPARHPDGLLGQPGGLHQPRHASSRRSRTASRRRSSPTTRRTSQIAADDHPPGGVDRARRARRSSIPDDVRLLVEEISHRRPRERPRRPVLRRLGARGHLGASSCWPRTSSAAALATGDDPVHPAPLRPATCCCRPSPARSRWSTRASSRAPKWWRGKLIGQAVEEAVRRQLPRDRQGARQRRRGRQGPLRPDRALVRGRQRGHGLRRDSPSPSYEPSPGRDPRPDGPRRSSRRHAARSRPSGRRAGARRAPPAPEARPPRPRQRVSYKEMLKFQLLRPQKAGRGRGEVN